MVRFCQFGDRGLHRVQELSVLRFRGSSRCVPPSSFLHVKVLWQWHAKIAQVLRDPLNLGHREELLDDLSQLGDALRGVDGDSKMRSVLEALRVPRVQRAQLVDDPSLAPARRCRLSSLSRSDVPEPLRFVDTLVDEQIDVVEKEPGAFLGGDFVRQASFGELAGLLEDPGIA